MINNDDLQVAILAESKKRHEYNAKPKVKAKKKVKKVKQVKKAL